MAHIIVVDDEEQIRNMIQKILTGEGHEVSVASDGEEALALINSLKPDLVITDILMPQKGGLSLILDLQKEGESPKILAISGGGKDGRLCFLSTARTFKGVKTLKKPFSVPELAKTVTEMLEPSGNC